MMDEFRVGFECISHRSIEDLSTPFYDQFDGVLAERCGQITVWVYAAGASGLDAAVSVIPLLERIGLSVVRTDRDIVDGPEIASRLNVSRQAVQNWATGTRGSAFPHPVGQVGGKRIWTWSQVVEWGRAANKIDEEPGLTLDEMACVDALLAQRRMAVGGKKYSMTLELTPGAMKPGAGLGDSSDYTSTLGLLTTGGLR